MSMGAAGEEFHDINVTPLTDVFLVLLVIMILIAPLIDSSNLKIKPPPTKNAQKVDEGKGITIEINKVGQIAINGTIVEEKDNNPEGLTNIIRGMLKTIGKADVACTVNADGDAHEKVVVSIMSAAAAAGIKHMRVATVQESNY